MRLFLKHLIFLALILQTGANAEDEHGEKDHKHEAQEKDEHGEAGHKDEGEEEEAEGGSVGPEKGILEADRSKGFKLSPEALKNFEIKTIKLTGDGPWAISVKAIVHSGEEINLYRLRGGFFKSIDFQTIKKSDPTFVVDSDDMREGDEIVVSGLGFLKIAELSAFGGIAHGHSH